MKSQNCIKLKKICKIIINLQSINQSKLLVFNKKNKNIKKLYNSKI